MLRNVFPFNLLFGIFDISSKVAKSFKKEEKQVARRSPIIPITEEQPRFMPVREQYTAPKITQELQAQVEAIKSEKDEENKKFLKSINFQLSKLTGISAEHLEIKKSEVEEKMYKLPEPSYGITDMLRQFETAGQLGG